MQSIVPLVESAVERLFKRSNARNALTTPSDLLGTGLTRVRLTQVKSPENGRRAWDVEISHNDSPVKNISLVDPIEARQYYDYFKFFADDSFEPTKHNRSSADNEAMLKLVEQVIPKYSNHLLRMLDLDSPAYREKKRDILVIEDYDLHNKDEESLHNLVWELLEDPIRWNQTNPTRISVTRVIAPSENDSEHDKRTTITPELGIYSGDNTNDPLRMLLVIGRSLMKEPVSQSDWVYKKEKVSPSLIQHSVMQTMRHLKDIGHHRKVQLKILRPATFVELNTYLGIDPEQFDIVHLDMHGEMRPTLIDPNGTPRPHLAFTEVPLGPPAYILASDVAQALRGRTKLLVMNACNSSSESGEPGIRMVRTFLQEDMGAISATSYRLQETAAKIYYPVFYMSLLLYGSFNRAAAEARQALRKNKKRHNDEERDDFYVQWNWSSTANLIADREPVRSTLLHFKMLLELLPRLVFWILAHICMSTKRKEAWKQYHTYDYPMYAIHRQFESVGNHVQCAEQLDIPSINLYTLEVEYWLKNSEKHSVYLHAQHANSDPGLQSIRGLIRNTVRMWVQTEFVSEVRILNAKRMLEGESRPWSKPRHFWNERNYRESFTEADWSWRRSDDGLQDSEHSQSRKMLVIDGFEALAMQEHQRKPTVLQQMATIATSMDQQGVDLYVITIGGLLEPAWNQVGPEFSIDVLGAKWAGAQVLKLPLRTNPAVSTFCRKVRKVEIEGDRAV
ncbi:hypothetical protein BDV96DRAFT_589453 [Lophiotrema nucula]|uniref:Uncharacterized protein n=1 Tax=Lophiotrema nucula TaxID=690887 RepID=A0A6A5YJZ1_9PLEO|nr:hypothetical protein BDV96DRAFT_589453 [Lophiotrema nucula]